jgi:hypothetical protein
LVEETRFLVLQTKAIAWILAFGVLSWGLRNRVSGKNLGLQGKIIAETRFLGLEAALYCF